MAQLVIRKMELDDINEVMKVDAASFSSPWPEEIFKQEINTNDHAHYFVAVVDQVVVGYAGLWIVIDDAQITNIAILPNYRGNKIGEKLFKFSCQYALQLGVKRLSLEVRASNTVAQNMYRKFGLIPGGIRKNYYTDNGEDAVIMWVNLL
ncbi:ribosomal protein S18-alanine N-acetyltransferase [Virgibacillus sp. W0430]|uniref:ribosomal protein S18-alanine N-acetyltransferase n=1 Tax=Virgibacillus sp. W0430 TaxID=3391580 RepID=UPI003F450A87